MCKGVEIIYEVEFNFFTPRISQFSFVASYINIIESISFKFSVSKRAKCSLENFCPRCVLLQAGIIDFLTQYGHLPASFNSFSLGAIPFLTFPMLCPVDTVQNQIFRLKTKTKSRRFVLCYGKRKDIIVDCKIAECAKQKNECLYHSSIYRTRAIISRS